MTKLVALLILLAGTAGWAHAQASKKPEKQCGDYATQSEMNDCAAQESRKADEALNATYQELISKIKSDSTATVKLIAAEKAWIAFRDAELAAEWPVPDGENPSLLYGSVHPFCYFNELTAMTLERQKTLKAFMRREEGDVCSSGLGMLPGKTGIERRCRASKKKRNSGSTVTPGSI